MRRTIARLATGLLLALALAACTDPVLFPDATVEQVGAIAPDGSFSVTGSNFFQYPGGRGMRVEACGVTLDASIVDPATAEVLLPPAGVVKVQTGERLTVALPEGLRPGNGDVRVIRPDGQVVVLEGAFECYEAAVSVAEFRVLEAGVVGSPTRFGWRVEHSGGGEALACTLDPGDGSASLEIADCRETTSIAHAYQAGGAVTTVLTVRDAGGRQAARELSFVVGHAPPVAYADELTVSARDLPLGITAAELLANDAGEGLTITSVAGDAAVTWDAVSGVITYDPGNAFERLAAHETATVVFSYVLADVRGATAQATVTLNVQGVDRVLGVSIDQDDHEVLPGGTTHLSVTVDAVGGVDRGVLWESSDPDVARVDQAGVVTGVGAGSATITATSRHDSGVSDSVTLTVPDSLTLTIDTSLASGTEFQLGLYGSGTVRIAWGDGTVEEVTDPRGPRHRYAADGAYTIRVTGTLTDAPLLRISSPADARMITSVGSWGELGLTSLNAAFLGASNLTSVPDWLPTSVTDMTAMFYGALSFNADIGGWDTGNVTDMTAMFIAARAFDADIGGWDTSSVRYMDRMFDGASSFDQDLSRWCVERIPSAPLDFSVGASSWSPELHPRWGAACG